MLPPRKDFEADDRAGSQVDLRLEERKKLIMLEADANGMLQLAAGNQRLLHAGVEPDRPGRAGAAGTFQSDVRAAEKVRRPVVMRGRLHRNANKGSDLCQRSIDVVASTKDPEQRLPDLLHILRALPVAGDGNGEFITAEPGDDGVSREFLPDAGSDPPQQFVPDVVAVAIVHRLEALHLHGQNGDVTIGIAGFDVQLLQTVSEALAVGEAGEDVRGRHDRGAALSIGPQFGFVLQVDVAAPAEEDQGHVENQGSCRDLHAGAEARATALRRDLEKGAPVPDEQHHGGHEDQDDEKISPCSFCPAVCGGEGTHDRSHAASVREPR